MYSAHVCIYIYIYHRTTYARHLRLDLLYNRRTYSGELGQKCLVCTGIYIYIYIGVEKAGMHGREYREYTEYREYEGYREQREYMEYREYE